MSRRRADSIFYEGYYLLHAVGDRVAAALALRRYLGLGRGHHHGAAERELRALEASLAADERSELAADSARVELASQPRSLLRRLVELFVYPCWAPVMPFPPARVARHEDVRIRARDGVWLHGRYYPCPDELAAPLGRPRPTVLFFHGNGGDVKRWRSIGSRWQDAVGAHVLVVDYRGYGRSEGWPSEPGLALDARAAYRFVRTARGVDPSRLLLAGQSLGGAIAVELATSGHPHAALVLESTFTSLAAVLDRLFLGLPAGRLLPSAYPSRERLEGYAQPLFVSHGTWDLLIPPAHGAGLVEVAAGPKDLLLLPRMGHHDRRGSTYGEALQAFLRRSLA
ncbi:MAG: alpha/beta hydrolase [Sandaracinaceae bacterium]